MLLKNLFLLLHLFCNVEFEFSWFHNTKQSSEILILEIEALLELQNKTDIEMMGSVKKVLLEISQNLQGNTCARVSFLTKFQAWGLQL